MQLWYEMPQCTACPILELILLATYFCLALAVEWKYVPALFCTNLRPIDLTLFVASLSSQPIL